MIFIDSDNALGSPSGDVDDAYALAALLTSGLEIAGLSACAGNTSADRAHANNVELARLLRWHGPVVRTPDLRDFAGRIVALGPLTNIVQARRAAELIIVGGHSTSRGRWPPFWPYEFNLTRDRAATRAVFDSALPLTIFPLDVARRLTIRRSDLDSIGGALGEFFRRGSERWFRHLRRTRLMSDSPVYDLAAALYVLGTEGFTLVRTTAEMMPTTALRFGKGAREVTLCVDLDRDLLWRRFLDGLHANGAVVSTTSSTL